MAKARKQRRLKSADEAFMGPKPTYAEENGEDREIRIPSKASLSPGS